MFQGNTMTGIAASDPMDEQKIRRKGFISGLIPVIIMGVLLFGSAGTLVWPMAWVILGTLYLATFLVTLICHEDLITERLLKHDDADTADAKLVKILNLSGLIPLIVAGLQFRYGWEGVPALSLQMVAGILFLIGYGIFSWAMLTNRFFSLIVRIQNEKGHHVITDGPYRFVRHPGYAGFILIVFSQPIMLGSFPALITAVIPLILLGIRTKHEDRILSEKLEGYREYSEQVRYRLIPGVW